MGRSRMIVLSAMGLAGAACPAPAAQTAVPVDSSTFVVAQSSGSDVRVPVPLDIFVRAAVDRNLTFLASEASLGTARYNAKAARTAFDPTFNAGYQQNRNDQQYVFSPGAGSGALVTTKNTTLSAGISKNTSIGTNLSLTAQTQRNSQVPPVQQSYSLDYVSNLTLTLTQPLLQGGGRAAAYAAARIAELGGAAALATAQRTLESVIAETEGSYWALRLQERNEDTALRSLQLAEEMLRRNQKLNQLKLISDHDVLTAEEGVENRRVTYLGAVHARQDAADDLVFLAYGEAVREKLKDEHFEVRTATAAEVSVPPVPDLEAAVSQALAARADVVAARRNVEAADASLAAAANGLLPQLNVTGSIGRGGTDVSGAPGARGDSIDGVVGNRDRAWSVGTNFAIPIGNRPQRAKYDSALETREQARLALASAENAVRVDVRKAMRAVQTEAVRYRVAQHAADVSWRQFRQEQERLRLGLEDSFRVLQAQDLAFGAEVTLESVRYNLAVAVTNFRLALGTIAAGYMQNLRDFK